LEVAFIEFVWSVILSPNWSCFIDMIQGALEYAKTIPSALTSAAKSDTPTTGRQLN